MPTKSPHGGRRNEAAAQNGKRVGRPRKDPAARFVRDDKVAVWISLETAGLLQTLMLQEWPGVETPEQLIEYAVAALSAK